MNDISLKTAILARGLVGGGRPVCSSHPSLPGVSLGRVVDSTDSNGELTTLVVTLEPFASMAPHWHEAETEQHIVLAGEGVLKLDGIEHVYLPGDVAIIPKTHEHSVVAGEFGMVLLAIFTPGLH